MDSEPYTDPGLKLSADRLNDFLLALREDREYDLGLPQFLAAQELIISLAAAGLDVDDPELLRRNLRPLVCTSRSEQAEFDELFETWRDRIYVQPAGDQAREERQERDEQEQVTEFAHGLDDARRSLQRVRLFVGAGVLVAGALIYLTISWLAARNEPGILTLTADPGPAWVVISSRADLSSDADSILGLTPISELPLHRGTYEFSIRSPGFETLDTTIVIRPGASSVVDIAMDRMREGSWVLVPGAVSGATVFVDGIQAGFVTDSKALSRRLSRGPHVLRLAAAGFVERRISIVVDSDTVTVDVGTMTPVAAAEVSEGPISLLAQRSATADTSVSEPNRGAAPSMTVAPAVAMRGGEIAVKDTSGFFRLHDAETGVLTKAFSPLEMPGLSSMIPRTVDLDVWNVRALDFVSSDVIAAGTWSGTVELVDIRAETSQQIHSLLSFRAEDGSVRPPMITDLKFVPADESILLTSEDGRFRRLSLGGGILFESAPGIATQGLDVMGDTAVVGGTEAVYLGLPDRSIQPLFQSRPVVDLAPIRNGWLHATADGSLCLSLPEVFECYSKESRLNAGSITESIALTNTGFAVGRHDGAIGMLDQALMEETGRLEGHTDRIMDLAVDPTGRYLASASWDQTVRIWDLERRTHIVTLFGHTAHVWSVAWSSDGRTLVSGGRDGTVRVWNVSWLRYVEAPGWLASLSHGSDQNASGLFTVLPDDDGSLRVVDRRTSDPVMSIAGNGRRISALSQSPSGTRVVTGDSEGALHLLNGPIVLNTHNPVEYGTFSPQAGEIATITNVGERIIWSGETGEHVQYDESPPVNRPGSWVWDNVVYSEDGLIRFSTGSSDMVSGDAMYVLEIARPTEDVAPEILLGSEPIDVYRFRPSGTAGSDANTRYVAIETAGRLFLIDASKHESSFILRAGEPTMAGIEYGGFGASYLASDIDRFLLQAGLETSVWSIGTNDRIAASQNIPRIAQVATSRGEMRFITLEAGEIRLWSGETLTEIATIPYDNDLVGATFNRTGEWLAVSNRASDQAPGAIRIWDSFAGRQVGEALTQPDGVLGVVLDDTGDSILSWGDYSVQIWDLSLSRRTFDRYVPATPDGVPVGVDAAVMDLSRNRVLVADRTGIIRGLEADTGIEDVFRIETGARIGGLYVDVLSGDIISWSSPEPDGLQGLSRWDGSTGRLIWRSECCARVTGVELDAARTMLNVTTADGGSESISWALGAAAGQRPIDESRSNADENGLVTWDEFGFAYVFPAVPVEVTHGDTLVAAATVSDDGRVAASFGDGSTEVWPYGDPRGLQVLSQDSAIAAIAMDPVTGSITTLSRNGRVMVRTARPSRVATVDFELVFLANFLLFSLIPAWMFWRRRSSRRANRYLVRERRRDRLEKRSVRLQNVVDQIIPSTAIHRLSSALRRRFEIASNRLDVPDTLHRTIRRAGLFTPAFGSRFGVPEYVVLIERVSFRDHQSRYVDEIVSELADADVVIRRYYFDGDPRVCFPADGRERPILLSDLAAATPGHRLLIFGSVSGFFNPVSGVLSEWISVLEAWSIRYLVAMEDGSEFGWRGLQLRERFTDVVPCTVSGLLSIAGVAMVTTASSGDRTAAPFPDILRKRPRMWVDPSEPEDSRIDSMLRHLTDYLGPDGMAWFRAAAVYPDLDWRLTVYLGHALRGSDQSRLLKPDLILRLVRLPWFRLGTIPDWMRERLLREMSDDEETHVRAILNTLIFRPSNPDANPLNEPLLPGELDIAVENARTVNALARRLLDSRADKADQEHPLRDQVLVKFLRHKGRSPLALRIPRTLLDALTGGDATAGPLRKAGGYAVVGLIGLLLLMAASLGSQRLWRLIPQTVVYVDMPVADFNAGQYPTAPDVADARRTYLEYGLPVEGELPQRYHDIVNRYFASIETKDHQSGLDSLMGAFAHDRRVIIEMIHVLEQSDHLVPKWVAALYLGSTDPTAWSFGMMRYALQVCETLLPTLGGDNPQVNEARPILSLENRLLIRMGQRNAPTQTGQPPESPLSSS